MKIGILTFPNSPSYGASLQMYGLYKTVESLGYDVEIINYRNSYMSQKKHITIQKRNILIKMILTLLDLPSKIKFYKFERQLIFYPKHIISESDNLNEIGQRYDYMICGSDQVWNPHVTGKDMNYFFTFCKNNNKKISYAASFGIDKLDKNYSESVRQELDKFKSISVREIEGEKIVEDLLKKPCEMVLDPSMLLEKNKWISIEKKVSGLPSKYVARFIFNNDIETEKMISELSEKTKLPVVTIGGTLLSKLKNKLYTGSVSPSEWLYILDNAEYVVTDSFHGAAFSIILNKELYVSLASSTNSRLKTLMHTFELDNRIIGNRISDDKINYNRVQELMIEKRKSALDYLKNSLGN